MTIAKHMARLAAWSAAGIATALGILVCAAWVEHTTAVTLPAPSGPYTVGRVCLDWSREKTDAFAPTPGTRCELLAWIWYPGASPPDSVAAPFLPLAIIAELRRARGAIMSGLLTHDLRKVGHHSVEGCAFACTGPCPVVILRGGASSEVWNYSSLAEELASHGYVVVGIDAPYRTNVVVFPDGRVASRQPSGNPENLSNPNSLNHLLNAWVEDMSATADQLARINARDPTGIFAGHLDLSRLAAIGHSFGGAQAAEFCVRDQRVRCGVDIDGLLMGDVTQRGIAVPFMFLLSDHHRESPEDTLPVLARLESVYDRLPPRGRAWAEIHGSNHFLFSDDGTFFKSRILVGGLRLFGIVEIDPARQSEITRRLVLNFLETHLNAHVPAVSELYPEVTIKR